MIMILTLTRLMRQTSRKTSITQTLPTDTAADGGGLMMLVVMVTT